MNDVLRVLAKDLRKISLTKGCQEEHPLGALSTYKVGGSAALFVQVESPEELQNVASVTARHDVCFLVIGRGSNLLVADQGFAGLVVQLGADFESVSLEEATVTAGGAALLPVVARRSVQAGLQGFAWAVGVPGSIGGAVRMNAGGHGAEMKEVLQSVLVVDLSTGETSRWSKSDLALGYRRSALKPCHVVVEATLLLAADGTGEGPQELTEIVQWRRNNQPGGQNAGSVFANPSNDSAGRLIESVGLKGHRLGTAEVSTKHANFIQADPQGRADDIYALMQLVQKNVLEETGVALQAETVMVGFADEHGG